MNDNAHYDATNRPISIKNEATPDAAVFAGATRSPTSGAAAGAAAGAGTSATLGEGSLYCNRTTTTII